MGEKVAIGTLATGITLFGISLADIAQMATIFAGITGGLGSLAALIYYVVKTIREK
jgi:hypothetical protein